MLLRQRGTLHHSKTPMTEASTLSPTSLSWKLGLNMPMHRRVFASFFLYAFCIGGFFPRSAEIQRSMGVGEGALGLALIGVAAGTLVSLTFGGPLVERAGHRRVFLYLLPVLPVFYALAAVASSPVWMFVSLFPAGLMLGAIEVAVNLDADRAEHATGRRIMNRSHAFWSIGFFSAAAMGSLMAYLEVSPLAHQLVVVLVTLPAMVLEGAGFDWSAIYMRDIFNATPFMGGVAVATGAAAQAFTPYVADRFVERHSPVLVARCLLQRVGRRLCAGLPDAESRTLAAGFCADGGGQQRHLPAGHVGRRAAHRPALECERGGPGANRVRVLPAGAAFAGLCGAALWHSVGVWGCLAAGGAEPECVVRHRRFGQAQGCGRSLMVCS